MAGEKPTENRRETRSGANSSLHLLKDLLSPSELSTLSNDSKLLYKAIDKSLSIHIKEIIEQYDEQLAVKESQIADLTSRVASLEETNKELHTKLNTVQNGLDAIDQYERRDSLIISGDVLPRECDLENSTQVIVNTINSYLSVPITSDDINVAHRLGRPKEGQSRPIIVKLMSRSKKAQIVRARLALPKPVSSAPSLYTGIWGRLLPGLVCYGKQRISYGT